MKKILTFLIFVLSMCSFTSAQTDFGLDKVKKIKLLNFNRQDVEKVFGNTKSEIAKYDEWFYMTDARIRVSYSAGRCNSQNFYKWNVPEWQVINITIFLESRLKLKGSDFNVSQYKIERVSDVRNGKIYTNPIQGIKLTVTEGDIDEIKFSPSQEYQHLSCND